MGKCFLLLIVLLGLVGSVMAEEQPSLEFIKQMLHNNYSNKSLHTSGQVTTQTVGQNFPTSFEARIYASGNYWLDYQQDLGFYLSAGTVEIKDYVGFFTMENVDETEDPQYRAGDPELIIAAATGVSAGAAYLVRQIQLGEWHELLPQRDLQIVQQGDTWLLSGSNEAGNEKVVIEIRAGYIYQVTSTMSDMPEQESAEDLTEQDLNEVLKVLGQEPTAENAATLRQQLAAANAVAQMTPMPMTWMTTFNAWQPIIEAED